LGARKLIMSINNQSKVAISTSPKVIINISNPASVKELFDNMSNDLSLITSYMDLAVSQCTQKNTHLVTQKEEITNLTSLAKKYNQESINLDSQLHQYQHTISIAEHEVLKAKTALDGVMQLASDMSQTDVDKIKKILEDSFNQKTTQLENINKELALFEKSKNIKDDKVAKLQDSLSKMEASYFDQVSNTNLFTSNVEKTIVHITQMYSDIMTKSNDMLQMTINVKQNNILSPIITSNNDTPEVKQVEPEPTETIDPITSQPIFIGVKNFDNEKAKLLN